MNQQGALETDTTSLGNFQTGRVTGDLSAFTIFDLTQMMMLSQKSGLLNIECGKRKGYVYFENGQIVSVTDDSLFQGTAAAFRVFLWKGGKFDLDLSKRTSERNIRVATENLMLDIARQLDEANLGVENDATSSLPWASSEEADEDESIELVKQERLRQINQTFDKIANAVLGQKESRSDPLIDRLVSQMVERNADAVFLIPGSHPQIRVSGQIDVIPELERMRESTLEDIVAQVIPSSVRQGLAHEKEVQVLADRETEHPYKIVVNIETGGPVISLHSLPNALDVARKAEVPEKVLESISGQQGGVVLVSGAPIETLETTVAGLVGEAANETGCLASLLLQSLDFALTPSRGLVIVRKVRSQPAHVLRALRRTSQQNPKVIGLSFLHEPTICSEVITQARKGVSFVCGLPGKDLDESLALVARVDRNVRESSRGQRSLVKHLQALVRLEDDGSSFKTAKVLAGATLASSKGDSA